MFVNNKSKMKRQIKKKKLNSTDKLVVLNEEELIQQVAMRPVIYDRSLKAYRKTSLRKQCWSDISEAMDAPVEECRRRWRSLRDSFSKHYKLQQRNEESALNKHRRWLFYDKMTFLIPHLDGVSYDFDKILDEPGDISEDGQSINCDPVVLNSANESLEQEDQTIVNTNVVENHAENNSTNIRHSSVSVQATDFISVSMEDPQQATMHANSSNIDNNFNNCTGYTRLHQACNNHHNPALSAPCGDTSRDSSSVLLDSDEKFLLSCAPALRRLTFKQNALARLKIQQLLYDIEFQHENN